jgi:hypothetical protein
MPNMIKKQAIHPYLSESNGQIRLVMRIKDTDRDLNRQQLITNIKQQLKEQFNLDNQAHLTGAMVLYNNMLQSLFNSQIITIGVIFLIIFIMFLIIFRSLTLSISAIISNMVPALLILGLMGLLNIPLNLMTITTATISIGIGIDNAIHYIYRYKQEFQKDGNYLQTMYRAHTSIGLAMFYTSLTVTLGFFILILSNFIPSIYFGIFTAIAMIVALFSNLTLLPKLILWAQPNIRA